LTALLAARAFRRAVDRGTNSTREFVANDALPLNPDFESGRKVGEEARSGSNIHPFRSSKQRLNHGAPQWSTTADTSSVAVLAVEPGADSTREKSIHIRFTPRNFFVVLHRLRPTRAQSKALGKGFETGESVVG